MNTGRSRLPDELRKRVLDSAVREASPVRASVRRSTQLSALALAAVGVALFFASGGVRVGTRPPEVVAVTAAGWFVLAVAATWIAFGRGRSMLGRPAPWLLVVALATAPTFLLWFLAGTATWPEANAPIPALRLHFACFATAMVFALAPLNALVLSRRGSDPVKPRLTGAALGAAAGAWAGVMIDLHCAMSSPAHVVAGHLGPIVLLALVGALLGRRVLGIRA